MLKLAVPDESKIGILTCRASIFPVISYFFVANSIDMPVAVLQLSFIKVTLYAHILLCFLQMTSGLQCYVGGCITVIPVEKWIYGNASEVCNMDFPKTVSNVSYITTLDCTNCVCTKLAGDVEGAGFRGKKFLS